MKKFLITPENPKGILVDMTSEEIAQKEKDNLKIQKEIEELKQAETDKETKKASGRQKLLDLGLTEAEVKALIGV